MKEFGITTPERQAAFLAQLAHESNELRSWEERPSSHSGPNFEKYDGRRALGNTKPGDGKRFRGRGPIQLTGRSNYTAAGKALGVDLVNNPRLAATPEVGFRVAGWYWKTRGLNELADKGAFKKITKRINGGYNGLADRQKYFDRAKKAIPRCDQQPGPSQTTRWLAYGRQKLSGSLGQEQLLVNGRPGWSHEYVDQLARAYEATGLYVITRVESTAAPFVETA